MERSKERVTYSDTFGLAEERFSDAVGERSLFELRSDPGGGCEDRCGAGDGGGSADRGGDLRERLQRPPGGLRELGADWRVRRQTEPRVLRLC